ncbi:glycosyltransferase [Pediococcus pentosaceus]|uniref:glycosyltransferase n=1 Tax=Pediococcus pentosaceus TaxID=1255 RepID=UPI0021E8862E|nr:glycosyltransferase [Pediococcus pentosaceus]MCV3320371.1 glycosyltransferase [Pediococcus pentosaceus]
MKKIKVIYTGADNIGYGGRSTIAFNLANSMSMSKIKIDFLASKKIDSTFEQSIVSNGGQIVSLGKFSNNKIIRKVQRAWRIIKVLKKNKYDIIHIHADDGWEAINTTILAKFAGVTKIIVHGHSSGSTDQSYIKKILISLFRPVMKHSKYIKFAVTKESALYMFGTLKNVHIIRNGIHVEKYKYDLDIRNKVRKELKLENNYTIGCVARFSAIKNHKFLIDVFKKILVIKKNAKLVLVGGGELFDEIKKYVDQNNLQSSVLFLGNRKDVNRIMQALDVFVLPSVHEGLGLVNIEAQAAGLPCIVSNGIPRSAKVLKSFEFLSLEGPTSEWVNEILKYENFKRSNTVKNVIEAGYDINNSAKEVEELYVKSMSNY